MNPNSIFFQRIAIPLLISFSVVSLPACAQSASGEEAAVSAVLDALHEAASKADWDTYFDLYADSSVFMGTDATERWTSAELRGYADGGSGWTYIMSERHVYLAEDGNTAWFDEILENENLGLTRGTGVLIKNKGTWRIAQYNLTIPVPNQLAREFVAAIRALPESGN